MPITIDEILERDRLRVQESEWAELVEELQDDPELQELFADDWLICEHSGSTKFDIIDEWSGGGLTLGNGGLRHGAGSG